MTLAALFDNVCQRLLWAHRSSEYLSLGVSVHHVMNRIHTFHSEPRLDRRKPLAVSPLLNRIEHFSPLASTILPEISFFIHITFLPQTSHMEAVINCLWERAKGASISHRHGAGDKFVLGLLCQDWPRYNKCVSPEILSTTGHCGNGGEMSEGRSSRLKA